MRRPPTRRCVSTTRVVECLPPLRERVGPSLASALALWDQQARVGVLKWRRLCCLSQKCAHPLGSCNGRRFSALRLMCGALPTVLAIDTFDASVAPARHPLFVASSSSSKRVARKSDSIARGFFQIAPAQSRRPSLRATPRNHSVSPFQPLVLGAWERARFYGGDARARTRRASFACAPRTTRAAPPARRDAIARSRQRRPPARSL